MPTTTKINDGNGAGNTGNSQGFVKNDRFEKGSFVLFDPTTWERIRKDNFIVEYDKLEQRMSLKRNTNSTNNKIAASTGPNHRNAFNNNIQQQIGGIHTLEQSK